MWSWSYGSWIYNYLCNQYLSPLRLWVRIPPRWSVLDTTLCDKVCQWLAEGRWFAPGTPVFSTNKIDCHNITEILLKVALNTIILTSNTVSIYKPIKSYWRWLRRGVGVGVVIDIKTLPFCHRTLQRLSQSLFLKRNPHFVVYNASYYR